MNMLLKGFNLGNDELNILLNVCLGLIAGIIICGGYVLAHKNKNYSRNFAITILLFPVIMTVVIPFIATDLKKAVSLAGIFALVRFRSIPGDSKDILYVFFALAVGIVIGLNSYLVAFVLTSLISVLFVLLQRYWKTSKNQLLKITIPEDMNYEGAFDDLFKKYLKSVNLRDVKTSNMGSLFTITYDILPKPEANLKTFIDELRVRNGNLNIVISTTEEIPQL